MKVFFNVADIFNMSSNRNLKQYLNKAKKVINFTLFLKVKLVLFFSIKKL